MSHLYGDTLYYVTSLFDYYVHGISYCRPEVYYFWIYYFFMNFIWIVIPFCKFDHESLLSCLGICYADRQQTISARVSGPYPVP